MRDRGGCLRRSSRGPSSIASRRVLLERLTSCCSWIGTALVVEASCREASGFLPEPGKVSPSLLCWGVHRPGQRLLGVAGGELIIPTLVFVFGAGTRVLASEPPDALPTVAMGVLRHRRLGSFSERADLAQTVAPMGVGSVVGAVLGVSLVGVVPAEVLKFVLGMILIVSSSAHLLPLNRTS